MKISLSYYQSDDVVGLAKDLLGKFLFSNIDNKVCGGIITETEAYAGIGDKASHAYNNRKTKRTSVMYNKGGCSYVYFTYGMHHLFNIVVSSKGIPNAILIRSIFATHGLSTIMQRRNRYYISDKNLCNGPAKLCSALGITLRENNILLNGNRVWLEERGVVIDEEDISTGSRVGVAYADEDALLPYRFMLNNTDTLLKYRSKKITSSS